jgi:dihydroorotate dehydrogenase (fumarate)
MNVLETTYLGLPLKSPVVVSSSGLTDSVDKIRELESYGAGAVVLKSLFEEQIKQEAGQLMDGSEYPEALDYIRQYTRSNSVDAYLKLIEEAKKAVSVPVIPSINCVSSDDWVNFARKIQDAGADALEINVFFLPNDKDTTGKEGEWLYFDLIERLKKVISIPLAIKLGPHFTNILNIIDQFYKRGVEGVVLFNRFFEPDIDIDNMQIVPSQVFSSPGEMRQVLRWVAMVSAINEQVEVAASTAVHDHKALVKYLLAGAQVVQVCSSLYQKGPKHLQQIVSGLESWMEQHQYSQVDQFRGMLNYNTIHNPELFERTQFIKHFSRYH